MKIIIGVAKFVKDILVNEGYKHSFSHKGDRKN